MVSDLQVCDSCRVPAYGFTEYKVHNPRGCQFTPKLSEGGFLNLDHVQSQHLYGVSLVVFNSGSMVLGIQGGLSVVLLSFMTPYVTHCQCLS